MPFRFSIQLTGRLILTEPSTSRQMAAMRIGFLVFSVVLMVSCRSQTQIRNLPPEAILIDSDGAVFWDDGAAIALLLQHPEKFKILGITTVVGNHWPLQAAEYIGRVLKVAGHTEIPIYIGSDQPLKNDIARMKKLATLEKNDFWMGAYSRPKEVRRRDQVEPVKGESLSGVDPKVEPAVDFIIRSLTQTTDPVTFVAIGPLTNLASALKRNPRIVDKISRLLIMGGSISVPGNATSSAELNFLFDPEAAEIVLSSKIKEKILFPLDLSNQVMIDYTAYQNFLTRTIGFRAGTPWWPPICWIQTAFLSPLQWL